jgi:Mor family transcriptional regulator
MTGIIEDLQRVVTDVTGNKEQASIIVHAILKHFKGERLDIPSKDYLSRNTEIKQLYRNHVSVKALSKRYQLSECTIYRIVKSND